MWENVNVEFSPSHGSPNIEAKSFINLLPPCVISIRLDFRLRLYWTERLNFEELSLTLQDKCPNLEILILSKIELSDTLLSVIDLCTQFLQKLKVLVLHLSIFSNCPKRDECGDISKIEVLDVDCCEFGYFYELPFSRMPYLKELRLSSRVVDDVWFKDGALFLSQLDVLDLECTAISSRTYQAIRNHALNLKALYLGYVNLDDDDLKCNNSMFPNLTD